MSSQTLVRSIFYVLLFPFPIKRMSCQTEKICHIHIECFRSLSRECLLRLFRNGHRNVKTVSVPYQENVFSDMLPRLLESYVCFRSLSRECLLRLCGFKTCNVKELSEEKFRTSVIFLDFKAFSKGVLNELYKSLIL